MDSSPNKHGQGGIRELLMPNTEGEVGGTQGKGSINVTLSLGHSIYSLGGHNWFPVMTSSVLQSGHTGGGCHRGHW